MIPLFQRRGPAYGRISNIREYLLYSYKNEGTLIEENILDFTPRHMHDWYGKAKACSLMAIDMIIGYHENEEDNEERRRKIIKRAKKFLYFDWRGTPVWAVPMIWRGLGYKVRHSMIVDFNEMKRELDAGYPFIMNLAWGDYPAHTITIIGYQIWEIGFRKVKVLVVADGWSNRIRYIDYNAMTSISRGTLASIVFGRKKG
ncbi:MAG: hypothetical protein GXZ11_06505 [Tissierellia bacterium]|nr:hypothetical protein [Tissierellia bacterium]